METNTSSMVFTMSEDRLDLLDPQFKKTIPVIPIVPPPIVPPPIVPPLIVPPLIGPPLIGPPPIGPPPIGPPPIGPPPIGPPPIGHPPIGPLCKFATNNLKQKNNSVTFKISQSIPDASELPYPPQQWLKKH